MTTNGNQTLREDDRALKRERTDERGDVAEPDAPTEAEENEGMSTILDTEPMTGVQDES